MTITGIDTRRAAPMTPDDRRSAIVTASLPLVRQYGNGVTTKQIAEASGVGEGTIFRVFADKAALIDAVLAAAFDPAPALAEFASIDRDEPLEPRLVGAVVILQRRLRSVSGLMMALARSHTPDSGCPKFRDQLMRDSQQATMRAIAELIEPDAGLLRLPPDELARTLRLLTFAGTHPGITDEKPLTAEQIVSVLLHGVLNRQENTPC